MRDDRWAHTLSALSSLSSLLVLAFLGIASAVGCTAKPFSPPGRISPLETASAVPRDDVSLQISSGYYGSVFGVEGITVHARGAVGVAEHVDVNFGGDIVHITNEGSSGESPNIWSARVGTRWSPEIFENFAALTGGAAVGASTGGGFVSPDVGMNLAWPNPYLVPYWAMSAFLSVPFAAQAVDVSSIDDPPGTTFITPQLTWGFTGAGGVMVPIELPKGRIGLFAGLGLTILDTDGVESSGVWGFNGGVELAF